jgi:hypothetical protein
VEHILHGLAHLWMRLGAALQRGESTGKIDVGVAKEAHRGGE